jgi:hypothetical protein
LLRLPIPLQLHAPIPLQLLRLSFESGTPLLEKGFILQRGSFMNGRQRVDE